MMDDDRCTGLNFRPGAYTATVSYHNIVMVCRTTMRSSSTGLQCSTSQNYGVNRAVATTISSLVGTVQTLFSFDAPTVSFLARYNSVASGGTSFKLQGFNFANHGTTPTIRLSSTTCETTTWALVTSALCLTSGGTGTWSMMLSVSGVVGTSYAAFTFDAPVLTRMHPYNSVTSEAMQVTLMGINFASSDQTPTVRIGSTLCPTTAWTATAQVVCHQGAHESGKRRTVKITIAAVVGTRLHSFSFDSPIVSNFLKQNAPSTGGSYTTIIGTNFAASDQTPTAGFTEVVCLSTSWTSNTQVMCTQPSSKSSMMPKLAVLTVAANVGTRTLGFTYDSPIVSDSSFNQPTSAGGTVTIKGLNSYGLCSYGLCGYGLCSYGL